MRAANAGVLAAVLALFVAAPVCAQGWEGFVATGVAAGSAVNALDEKSYGPQIGVGLLHSIKSPRFQLGAQLDVFPGGFPYVGARIGVLAQYALLAGSPRLRPSVIGGIFASQAGRPVAAGGAIDLVVARSFGVRVSAQDFFGRVVYQPFDCVYFGYGADCTSRGIGAMRAGWVHDPSLQFGVVWK
jgi:hypothetical protein